VANVRAAYLAYTAAEIDWYTALDKQVFGYEPPHVMLLHDNPLNADTVEEVLALFEQQGYKFVALAEALKEPRLRYSADVYHQVRSHVGLSLGAGETRQSGCTQ
jgi:hypothetical protein